MVPSVIAECGPVRPSEMPATRRLPALVERYVVRALREAACAVKQVRVTQTDEMFKKPGARAMRFTATERFAVDRVAFLWEARFAIAPLVSLKVLDGYAHGGGTLKVRALGLPVQTQAGRDVDLGEAYRYLAELPWVPQAIAENTELQWRDVDERTVEVSTAVGQERATVRIEFDDAGDIVCCLAEARPRDAGGVSIPTRWGGELSDYRILGGMRMPTRGEVAWELPKGRFVYWRGEITSAQALDEPFERS
jgi:hypothetical protein